MADQEDSSGSDEEFGIIRPSVIKCLKSILQQYPENGQILKEIIQNAEDAGARKVRFMLDWNTYGQDDTLMEHPGLKQFQGPALYAYNDALFTSQDWKGLQLLQDSLKEKDPMKIGRFGLGFKSVYHLTDLPSVLSGNYLGYFDPYECYFKNKDGDMSTGKKYKFSQSDSIIKRLRHQFDPFDGKYGCQVDALPARGYDGTLFRFPLRQKATQLSDSTHNKSSMKRLYDSFISDIHMALIFLHHVDDIELWWLEKGQTQPSLYCKVTASSTDRDNAVRLGRTRQVQHQNQEVVFPLEVTVQQNNQTSKTRWLISEVLGHSALVAKQKHAAVPVVGVAMPLDVPAEVNRKALDGQLFCYLPLSAPDSSAKVTGLPVHVNGTFSLSPDRHHILMPTAGQSWSTSSDLAWNNLLREMLLPTAYKKLILGAIDLHSQHTADLTVATVMSTLPDLNYVLPEWRKIALQVMEQLLAEHSVLYSEYDDGSWVNRSDALLEDSSCDERTKQVLHKMALQCHLKVVSVPAHVRQFLEENDSVTQMSPELLSEALRSYPHVCQNLTRDDKVRLLAYLLQHDGSDIRGLPLLPTADNSFATFAANTASLVYTGSAAYPASLLRGQESRLLHPELPGSLEQKMRSLAQRGKYQLRELDLASMMNLLPCSIPSSWKNVSLVGLRLPKSDPGVVWLYRVWKFLANQWPVNLCNLEDQPFLVDELDASNVTIYPMNKPSFLIKNSHKLAPLTCESLRCFGFQMLISIPRWMAHLVEEYTCPALPSAVVDVLCQVYSCHDLIAKLNNAATDVKIAFQQFLSSSVCTLPDRHREVLRHLPLFRLEGVADQFVNVATVREACLSKPRVSCHVQLLDVSGKNAKHLAEWLGATVLSAAQYLKTHMFNKLELMSDEDVKITVEFMIQNWPTLKQDAEIIHTLTYLKFVPTKTQGRVCPADMFSPKEPLLVQLFEGEDKFPASWMASQSYLLFLEQLGLKTWEHVTSTDLVGAAMTIAKLCVSGNICQLEKKAVAILQRLVSKPELMVDQLNTIQWLPPLDRPSDYPPSLHWKGTGQWCTPHEVSTKESALLTGSILLLSKLPLPGFLGYHMGTDARRDVMIVASQLMSISEHYTSTEKYLYLPMVVHIYKYLAKCDSHHIHEHLQDASWAWHGDGFVRPSEMCLERPMIELSPYMYVLPSDLQQVQALFTQNGVHERCGVQQCITILTQIGEKWLNEDAKESTQKADLLVVKRILDELCQHTDEIDEETRLTIPVPVAGAGFVRMMPLQETTCAPEAAIYQNEACEADNFVHPCISLQTATALNIKRLDIRIIGAEGLEFIQYGQNESLTDRLKDILSGYQDGYSVPKELVQNADDARATVVKFIWDERKNKDCSRTLLSAGMAHCHGPALWSYNDAVFIEQDYKNIISLSAGNKKRDKNTIGKFGLGFNSVYNLTDVPCFVSQGEIVIFDPHLVYLGDSLVNVNKPGVRIPFVGKPRLTRIHGDQFQPFQGIFGCDIMNNQSFDGTLFRFPLRTQAMANRSEISKLVYDQRHMQQLLAKLIQNASEILLFTQSVQRLELYHLPESATGPSDIVKVFEVSKKTKKILTCQGFGGQGQRMLDEAAHAFHRGGNPQEMSMTQVVTIEQRPGIQGGNDIPCQIQSGEQDYLMSHWLGCNESRNMAASVAEMGLTPLASVAMPVSYTDTGCIPSTLADIGREGRVYCYLPLPVTSGLPVHINGSFSVHSDRRQLTERNDDSTSNTAARWNEALLQDAVAEAYIHLLDILDKNCHPGEAEIRYCDFWPDVSAAPCMLPLLGGLYRKIAERTSTAVVYRGQTLTIGDVQFIVSEEIDKLGVKNEVDEALSVCATNSVCVPAATVQSFYQAGLGEYIRTKILTIQLIYTQVILDNLNRLAAALRDTLIIYALQKLDDKDVNSKMMITECIPVDTAESTLKSPSTLINPRSIAGELFSPQDLRFPSKTFCTLKLLSCLVELGMQETLMWPGLLERATSVKALYEVDRDAAVNRCTKLLELMGEAGACPEDVHQALMSVDFLPVIEKPENHPVPWQWVNQSGTPQLASAQAAYPSEHLNLVSASHPVVSAKLIPASVKHLFGFVDKTIPVEVVIHQLTSLIESPVTSKTGCVALGIYQYLGSICLRLQKAGEENTGLQEVLAGKAFIFIVNEFYPPAHVAGPHLMYDCPPYLCKLPLEYTDNRVKSLFHLMGYRDDVNIGHIVHSLQDLESSKKGARLSENERKLVLHLLLILCEELEKRRIRHSDVTCDHGDIFIPDCQGILKPSTSLCFMDPQWIDKKIEEIDQALTHGEISPKMAVTLGVKSRKNFFVKKKIAPFAFGQKEELVTRLRHIVDSYPFDTGILKEFLQNADDAGASEIHFILDTRTHKSDQVFSDRWHELQGPALLIYNNKPFSKDDLQGIQKLGIGSKETDPAKTGQYGIGFNAVYHLTDVPCFITRSSELERLCVLDPHCKHLEEATEGAAGGQFDDLQMLASYFPDVLDAFLLEMIPVRDATLFRFPLRSRFQDSKIKREPTTCYDVEKLLGDLKKEAGENLLFLHNLKEIKLSKIGPSGILQQLYSCSVVVTKEDEERRSAFCQRTRGTLDVLKQKIIDLQSLKAFQTSYQLHIQDSNMLSQDWLITQQIGFNKFVDDNSLINEAFESGKLCLSPRAGTAFCLRQKKESGVDKDCIPKQMCGKIYCMFPTHEDTSLPVHINGHFALMFENRRELWKNNIYPEKDYKRAWNELLFSQAVAPCFVTMLGFLTRFMFEDQTCDESVNFTASYEDLRSQMDQYFRVWPSLDGLWKSMGKSVYAIIAEQQNPLLPIVRSLSCDETSTGGASNTEQAKHPRRTTHMYEPCKNKIRKWSIFWLACSDPSRSVYYFPEEQKHEVSVNKAAKAECEDRRELKQVLCDSGFDLLFITKNGMKVIKHLSEVTDGLHAMTPESVSTFLRTFDQGGRCNLRADLPAPLHDTSIGCVEKLNLLLNYCLGAEATVQQAVGLPLMLTWDGCLHVFEAVNYEICTIWYRLFPQLASRFIHPDCILKLSKLMAGEQADVFLKKLDIGVLAELLQVSLPSSASCGCILTPEQQTGIPVDKQWFVELWRCIDGIVDDVHPEDPFEFLEPLSQFSLLYGRIGQLVNLYPAGQARQLIGGEAALHDVIRPIAQKLPHVCLPAADTIHDDVKVIHKIVASPDNAMAILNILHAYFVQSNTRVEVEDAHARCILEYVVEHLPIWRNCLEAKHLLRQLPVYKPKHGKRVAFMPATYAVPSVPRSGIDIWERKCDILFLDDEDSLQELYTFLDCQVLTVVQFYRDFIFQHLEYFEYRQRMHHLYFIYKEWKKELIRLEEKRDPEKACFPKLLEGIPFVTVQSNQLACADDFCDPNNPVYCVMEPERMPPPLVNQQWDCFNEREWHDFLRACGMKTDCTSNELMEYAKRIEYEGQMGGKAGRSHVSTKNKSETLIKYLVERFLSGKLGHNVFSWLRGVRFLCPSEYTAVFKLYHKSFTDIGDGKDRYVSFEESYEKCYCELAWTQAPVIDYRRWIGQRKKAEEFQSLVGMKKEPAVGVVLNHLQSLSQHWKQDLSDEQLTNVTSIFGKIFTYLQKHVGELTPSQLTLLTNMACVPVVDGRRLVPPTYMVVNLTEEQHLWPYLLKLTSSFAQFEDFLLKLGTTHAPTLKQYANVLSCVYEKCQKDRNGVGRPTLDLRYTASGAMTAMMQLLLKCKKVEDKDLPYLYLLSQSYKLVPVQNLVLDDAHGFYERLPDGMFDILNDSGRGIRKFEIIKLFRKLPKSKQPIWLSEILTETVCSKSKEMAVASVASAELQCRLQMPEFRDGIARLVNHYQFQNGVVPDVDHNRALVNKIGAVTIKSIPLHWVESGDSSGLKGLQTHLVYNGKPIPGSECEQVIFAEKVKGSYHVYLKDFEDKPLDAYQLVRVARVVNEMVGSAVGEGTDILPLLTCEPEEIESRLDAMNILQDYTGAPAAKKRRSENEMPTFGEGIPSRCQEQMQPLADGEVLFPGQVLAAKVPSGNKPVFVRIMNYCGPDRRDIMVDAGKTLSVPRQNLFTFVYTGSMNGNDPPSR